MKIIDPALQKIFKFLGILLLIGLAGWAIILIFQRLKIVPPFGDWFKSKPILIDNTPLVITQIKTIAELNTASMYKELVIDSVIIKKADLPAILYPFTFSTEPVAFKKELVLIVKGKVTAGMNLKNLPDSNVFVKADSVRLRLPQPVITDIFINPSDVETFYEQGKWSNEEVMAVKQSARRKLLEEAARQQLYQKAAEKAQTVMEQFLRVSGFSKITIQFY